MLSISSSLTINYWLGWWEQGLQGALWQWNSSFVTFHTTWLECHRTVFTLNIKLFSLLKRIMYSSPQQNIFSIFDMNHIYIEKSNFQRKFQNHCFIDFNQQTPGRYLFVSPQRWKISYYIWEMSGEFQKVCDWLTDEARPWALRCI